MDEAVAEQTVRKMKADVIASLAVSWINLLHAGTGEYRETNALREKLRKAIEDFDAA